MHYRRLGKTGFVISEIGLGGHWRAPWRSQEGGWWWGKFVDEPNPVVPDDVAKNRTDVVSACIDAGVNHVDITGVAEAMAVGAGIKGRRAKMIVSADDYKMCPRHNQYCNVDVADSAMSKAASRAWAATTSTSGGRRPRWMAPTPTPTSR